MAIRLKYVVGWSSQRNRQSCQKGFPMEAVRVATFAGPGAGPVIQTVPWPKIPKKAALIKVGACGVCGTDLHILKGHWPKPLPWPFTLGHEIGGVLVEVGAEFTEDFMSKPLTVG
jgi:D-arabinose 1-dehydrogenase-like Zn-dependent alcohol dehydrogenase